MKKWLYVLMLWHDWRNAVWRSRFEVGTCRINSFMSVSPEARAAEVMAEYHWRRVDTIAQDLCR